MSAAAQNPEISRVNICVTMSVIRLAQGCDLVLRQSMLNPAFT
jgi:hypothetical protein